MPQAVLQLPHRPLWLEAAPKVTEPQRSPLSGQITADVAIVGTGYSGLWTAAYLLKAKPSLRVVLLDSEQVGFGASGRNGGWLSAIFPISLNKVAQLYSHSAALELQTAMNATVLQVGQILMEEGIDADFAQQGFLSLARSAPQWARVQKAVAASTAFGLPEQFVPLDAKTAAEKLGVSDVQGALFTPHCATVHPGKLVHGLAAWVERLGGRIYEDSHVMHIEPGRLITPEGDVRFDTIIRATEAYSCLDKAYRRRLIPLHSLMLATEPLPLDLREQLKLNQRLAFNDMRHLRVYAQVTQDGRLVFGGRGAPYALGSTIREEAACIDGGHRRLYQALLDFFPELKSVAISHRWGGVLGVSRDWCPSVHFDAKTRIGFTGGYVGDGVATSNLAGRILRNLILGEDEAINRLPLVQHASPNWEAEPWRYLAINGGLAAARFADREERLTGRPSYTAALLERLTGAH